MVLNAVLKRINSALGLFTLAVLLSHIIILSVRLLKGGEEDMVSTPAYILMVLTILHGVLSMVIVVTEAIYGADKSENTDGVERRNVTLQRMTGIAVAVLMFLHISICKDLAKETPSAFESALYYCFQLLFIFLASLHSALSLPNALVGLDFIKTEKEQALISKASFALFGALAVLGLGAFGAYLLG